MKFGANLYNFPKYGDDLATLLAFVQTAEVLGYHHLRLLDHVVGIVAARHDGLATPYTNESYIHEVFTLMAWLAGKTEKIMLVSGVLVLPQRQAPLVAKQAAEVDILSGGRLILGVGVGYNPLEFEALGSDFSTRGARFEEQIEVLRRLWTDEVVTFSGRWHQMRDTSLAPRPVQRPIPLWFGLGRGSAKVPPEPVLRRVGRLADGWLPVFTMAPESRAAIAIVHAAAREAGRDPAALEMEMHLHVQDKSVRTLVDEVKAMEAFGASRLNVWFAPTGAAGEVEALKRFREVMDLVS